MNLLQRLSACIENEDIPSIVLRDEVNEVLRYCGDATALLGEDESELRQLTNKVKDLMASLQAPENKCVPYVDGLRKTFDSWISGRAAALEDLANVKQIVTAKTKAAIAADEKLVAAEGGTKACERRSYIYERPDQNLI